MARLRSEHPVFLAGSKCILVADIWQFLKPICSKLIKSIRKHLTVIWKHVIISDFISKLPPDPFCKKRWLFYSGITSGLLYRIKVLILIFLGKLPYISFKGVIDLSPVNSYPGIPVKRVPLFFLQKAKNKITD